MTQLIDVSAQYNNYSVETSGAHALQAYPRPAHHRVVLVSSHPLFAVGLRGELQRGGIYRVIAEARTAAEVLEIASDNSISLILIDQARPGEATLLIKTLQRKLQNRIPLVVLGANEDEEQVRELMAQGVSAYASKALDGTELEKVLGKALQSRRPMTGIRMRASLDCEEWEQVKPRLIASRAELNQESIPLSRRELQILEAIAEGCSNKEVANKLCISGHTLKNHLNNIFKKLDVEDRTQALMMGVRNGWVKL
ncbi:MAG TPA: response regulator transcription factor [Chloroflexia bacterium]|nr:response regulator transcription factor [Chloroflexia bacterium]